MAKTHAQRRRAEYQEQLRERLSQGKHFDQVIDDIEKITQLADSYDGNNKEEIDIKIKAKDVAIKHRLSLIKKYLPDLSNLSLEGEIESRTVLVDLSGGKLEKAMGDTNEPSDN
jgi:hypothetical protein